jgi:chromosome segregation ATPase
VHAKIQQSAAQTLVESALFFAIGFLCAALMAILAAPAVSLRATRLANARARLQAPLTETQARAERDALRGQHAVDIVRLERRLAASQWDRALAKAELGRQATRLVALDDLVKSKSEDIASQERQIGKLSQAVDALATENGAREIALFDVLRQRDLAAEAYDRARARIAELETEYERRRLTIAMLTTQVSGLELELGDWRAKYGATATGSADRIAELLERLQRSERGRESAMVQAASQLKTLAERETALAGAQSAREDLERRIQALEAQAKAVESELRQRLQALATTQAAAEGALTAVRTAHLERQREVETLRVQLDEAMAGKEGDAELRAAIAKLGRDFVAGRGVEIPGAFPFGDASALVGADSGGEA